MTARARESRPGGGGSSQHTDYAADPIVLREALNGLAEQMGWYESGVLHGIDIGRRQVEDEYLGVYEVSATIARQIAQHGPYDELAMKRGEPKRAARQRQILESRGVTA